MTANKWIGLGFAAALLTAIGCSSGGGGGTSSPTLGCSSGEVPVNNGVGLICGPATGSSSELVHVVMTGPASGATDLLGLNFDVTYDPAVLEFVPSVGDVSPLFPDALVVVNLFNDSPGRLVVSVQQTGGSLASVGIDGGIAVSLGFKRASGVATFGPTDIKFDNAEATTPSAPITYGTTALTLSYQ